MTQENDDDFYGRADAHIDLSNKQMEIIGRGKVSASMLYATARFNVYVWACGYNSGEELIKTKQELVDYFVEQYKAMLEEHVDDYAKIMTITPS